MTGENFSLDDTDLRRLAFENLSLLPLLDPPEASAIPYISPSTTSPLVVDLDGTLILTDSLIESVLQLIKTRPFTALCLLYYLPKGRAELKNFVAENTTLWVNSLPYRADLLEYIIEEKARGRKIVLATAAHHKIANAVASHLDVFDHVIASDAKRNLKGTQKLDAINELVGPEFVYAGDSSSDIPIWHASKSAITVDTSSSTTRQVKERTRLEKEFASPPLDWKVWAQALRCHQWVKNLLIFVPLLTGFAFSNTYAVIASIFAFIAFSLAASATYIGNDLWDIDNDRAHPRKKNRPFASGRIPITKGIAAAAALLTSALVIAAQISVPLLIMVSAYVVLTTLYSWVLKRYVLIDVITLALLYTFRVLAGSVASDLSMTYWLFLFSIFTFFSLALVKRCAELISLRKSKKQAAHGRDYQVEDLFVLYPLGIAASLCSVVVFGLYIGSIRAENHYAHPGLLWLVGVGLLYWTGRLWIKTVRGEMHDDPIVFAFKDFGSRVTVCGMVGVTLLAAFLP
ncbi:UbiA family prenyltransferase [Noviherbaspirillum sp. 1P10PC]|uniref:UbiA family prenyltransferase n=1 Tax=Noviherbaspirillum sp. 1P10PC TaxID=3132292 RepID=UPI0039A359F3